MEINDLIKNVRKYQKTREEYLFEIIINFFEPNIKYQVSKISEFYQDDLSQEIINKIHNAIINFKIKIDYSKPYEVEEETKFLNFMKQNFQNNVNNQKELEVKKYEYLLNVNECQFIKYVNKICNNVRISFHKNYIKKYEAEISLDKLKEKNVELLDYEKKSPQIWKMIN